MTLYRWQSPVLRGLNCGCAAGLHFALHARKGLPVPEILNNRTALSSELGVKPEDWICSRQVHSVTSHIVGAEDRGRGALSAETALPDGDAIILGEPGVNIMIFTADCLPLLLYDRRLGAAALIHSGWRGSADGIVPLTLDRMMSELGSRREDLFAAAGPAVGSCCYQVDRPVYEGMTKNFPETAPAFIPDSPSDSAAGAGEHWRLNLEEAVFLQLEREGMNRDQMEGSGLCSCCSSPDLPSWRREGADSGRMATFFCS
jgi:YfiH family protein